MSRQFPALAALLATLVVVATLPAVPVGTADSGSPESVYPVVEQANTTAQLELGGPVEQSGFATTGLDVGATLAADTTEINSRYARHRLDERYRVAENDTARAAVLRDAADDLDTRISSLRARERAALEAHAAGETSTDGYLRRLAVIDAEADHLSDAVTRLDRRADAVDGQPISNQRMARFKTRLVRLEGPVRDHSRRAFAGDTAPARVYVEAADDGTVAAMLTDSGDGTPTAPEYVREAYVSSARNSTAPDRFSENGAPDFDAVVTRAEELYPWAFRNRLRYAVGGITTGEPYLYRAGVYVVGLDHPHGTPRQNDLVAYFDGGTGDVFREEQYVSSGRLPTHTLGRNRTGRLALTVNATRPGGPAKANVTDAAGAPVSATVYVDGEPVDEAGGDGTLWFLAPHGRVNVTAVHDGARATVVGDAGSA